MDCSKALCTKWLELSKCFCLPTAHLATVSITAEWNVNFYQTKPSSCFAKGPGSCAGAAWILSWSVVHPWAAHTPKGIPRAQGPPQGPAHCSIPMGTTAHHPLAHTAASLGMQAVTAPHTCVTPPDATSVGHTELKSLRASETSRTQTTNP